MTSRQAKSHNSAFFLLFRRPPSATLFPYTPLFRSVGVRKHPPRAHGSEHARIAQHDIDVGERVGRGRKSTRLNSSHVKISYAVFCLKKKKCPHNTIT